jgi:transposase
MGQVVVVGLDIAKSVFQVHGVDADGEVVVRRRLRRSRVLPFFATVEPCRIGIEHVPPATIGHASCARSGTMSG